jgi:hypothetical protein
VDGNGGADGEEGGGGGIFEDVGEGGAVEVGGGFGEGGGGGGPDFPAGVGDLVFEGGAVALASVAPVVFGDEVGFGVFGDVVGLAEGGGGDVGPSGGGFPGVVDARRGVGFQHGSGAVHGAGDVGFVVAEAGECGDGEAGDDFLDEGDAAADFAGGEGAAGVEAEVDFFEVAVERDGDAAEAGVEEAEADEADEGAVVEEVEGGAGGDEGEEEGGVDFEVEHEEVAPFGGEEGAAIDGGRNWKGGHGRRSGVRALMHQPLRLMHQSRPRATVPHFIVFGAGMCWREI